MNEIVNQISRLTAIRTDIIEALKANNDPDVLATIDGDIDNAKYADLVPAVQELKSDLGALESYIQRNTTLMNPEALEGVTAIRRSGFRGWPSLALTSLPSSITSINTYSFQGCTGLTTLTLLGTPSGTIASTAFTACVNLLTINVPWASGAKAGAPWGATNATINYNYTP